MDNYYVYALVSQNNGRIYVGLSSNIQNRLIAHNRGEVTSTKPYKPWKIIYTEMVGARKAARNREKYLKSGCGKEFLKNIVDNSGT